MLSIMEPLIRVAVKLKASDDGHEMKTEERHGAEVHGAERQRRARVLALIRTRHFSVVTSQGEVVFCHTYSSSEVL